MNNINASLQFITKCIWLYNGSRDDDIKTPNGYLNFKERIKVKIIIHPLDIFVSECK